MNFLNILFIISLISVMIVESISSSYFVKLCAIWTPQQFSFESISNKKRSESRSCRNLLSSLLMSAKLKDFRVLIKIIEEAIFLCCTFDIKSRIHSISFRFCPAANRREFSFAACKWLRDYMKSKTKIVARKLSQNGIRNLEAFSEGWRWTRSAYLHK